MSPELPTQLIGILKGVISQGLTLCLEEIFGPHIEYKPEEQND